jgi:hypothetical protein
MLIIFKQAYCSVDARSLDGNSDIVCWLDNDLDSEQATVLDTVVLLHHSTDYMHHAVSS